MGREEVGVKTNVTSIVPHRCFAALSPPPHPHTRRRAAAQSLTYLGHVRQRPKLFWPRLFLTLGRRRHVVLRCYTLEQHVIRGLGKGRLCMGMAHMVLHLIKNPEV